MTDKQKAKAYDEALERARKILCNINEYSDSCKDIEAIFPELAKSEDERIRKEMIEFLNQYKEDGLRGVDITPWISYLEKQKEQKSEKLDGKALLHTADKSYEIGYRDGKMDAQKEQKPIAESKRLANEVIEYLTKRGYSPVLKDDTKKERFHIDIPRHKNDFWLSEEYMHCRNILGEYYMDGNYGSDTYTLYVWREKKDQKPVEWTDDDEQHLKWLCRIIHSRKNHGELSLAEESELGNWIDKWINHNPQPHWKPSEEQMKAFNGYLKDFQEKAEAAVGGWNNFDVMIRLYEQLKKLM